MNTKFTLIFLIVLVLLFSSSVLLSQQSQSNHPQSSGNKNKYKKDQTHNSKLNKPTNINNSKRKDFTINRKQTTNVNRKSERNNFKRELTNRRDEQNTTRSDNYFHIDKSGNTLWDGKHWDLDEYPLKVYVKKSFSRYYKSSYKDYVDYAFSVWQKADDRIKYTFTNNSRNADVEFVFVENLGKKYEENYLGLTEYDTNRENEIEFSKVQISLLKFGKEKISAGEIKATIVHELGHVLGLGHSDSETDIMYPYISSDHSYKMTYDELSRGDKEAIKDAIDLGNEEKYVWK
jgi:predicted Zn-dependent protease